MHDHGVLRAQQGEYTRQCFAQAGDRDAGELSAGARRVRQWAQDVEHGPHADFASRRDGVAHGGVIQRREHEAEPGLGDAARDALGWQVDRHAHGLQAVGRATRAGDAAVAVLGHAPAGGGDHKGADGADVEGPRAVAAGADDVDHVRAGVDPRGGLAHDVRQTGDLLGGFAFHAQRNGEPGDLRRRGVAVDQRAHRGLRFLAGEIVTGDELAKCVLDAHARRSRGATRESKFEFEKVGEQVFAVLGEDALGVELHALDGILAMADGHDHAAVTFGRDLEGGRQCFARGAQRVVADGRERAGQAFEHADAGVVDAARPCRASARARA